MGKYHDVELDSCLWAWIISPSVDNSQRCEKAQLGVIWTVAVWCSYLFQNIRNAMRSQHFGMKVREIRLMLTIYAPWWQISDGFLLRVYFCIFWLSSWQRIDRGCEPLRFQSHLVLIIINYQLGFSHEEVSFCSNIDLYKFINNISGFKNKKK